MRKEYKIIMVVADHAQAEIPRMNAFNRGDFDPLEAGVRKVADDLKPVAQEVAQGENPAPAVAQAASDTAATTTALTKILEEIEKLKSQGVNIGITPEVKDLFEDMSKQLRGISRTLKGKTKKGATATAATALDRRAEELENKVESAPVRDLSKIPDEFRPQIKSLEEGLQTANNMLKAMQRDLKGESQTQADKYDEIDERLKELTSRVDSLKDSVQKGEDVQEKMQKTISALAALINEMNGVPISRPVAQEVAKVGSATASAAESIQSQAETQELQEVAQRLKEEGENVVSASESSAADSEPTPEEERIKEDTKEAMDGIKNLLEALKNRTPPAPAPQEAQRIAREIEEPLVEAEKEVLHEEKDIFDIVNGELNALASGKYQTVVVKLKQIQDTLSHIVNNNEKFKAHRELERIKETISDVDTLGLTFLHIRKEFRHVKGDTILQRIHLVDSMERRMEAETKLLTKFKDNLEKAFARLNKSKIDKGIYTPEDYRWQIDRIYNDIEPEIRKRNYLLSEIQNDIGTYCNTRRLLDEARMKDVSNKIKNLKNKGDDYFGAAKVLCTEIGQLLQDYDDSMRLMSALREPLEQLQAMNNVIKERLDVNKMVVWITPGKKLK